MNKDILFSLWYDSLEGTKSQGFVYKAWCAGWEATLAQPEPFKPDWDMIEPYHERIKELEIENEKLRQALAQHEQEHESRITALEIRVAKLENPITDHEKQLMAGQRSLLRIAPVSKPWVSLTDEEIMEPWPFETRIELVRWIEAKLREKNK